MIHLSFWTRDRTRAPCSGSGESQPLDHQGISRVPLLSPLTLLPCPAVHRPGIIPLSTPPDLSPPPRPSPQAPDRKPATKCPQWVGLELANISFFNLGFPVYSRFFHTGTYYFSNTIIKIIIKAFFLFKKNVKPTQQPSSSLTCPLLPHPSHLLPQGGLPANQRTPTPNASSVLPDPQAVSLLHRRLSATSSSLLGAICKFWRGPQCWLGAGG